MRLLKKYNGISKPAKASLWFVLCSMIQKCVSFLTTPLFTRLMSADDFGVLSTYTSWQSILAIFLTLDLFAGVYNKAMIQYEDDKDGYTSSTLVLSSLLSVTFLIAYMIFHSYIDSFLGLGFHLTILLVVQTVFNTAMLFWIVRSRFEFEYRSIVFLTFGSLCFSIVLSVILILYSNLYPAVSRILGMVITDVVFGGICYILILRKGKKACHFAYWKYAVKYNLPLVPHYLAMQVLNQSDRIMINNICGPSFAGLYHVAYLLSFALNVFTNAIHASFSPWAYRKMKEGKYSDVGSVSNILIGGMLLLCILLSLIAPELLYILGGEKYTEAKWIVPPVTFSVLFNMIYALVATVSFYYEKTKKIMVGTLIAAVLNVALNAVFIPVFGYVAAGYTTLACYMCYALVHFFITRKVCREAQINNPFNSKFLLAAAIIGVVCVGLISGLYMTGRTRYFVILCFIIAASGLLLKHVRKVKTLFINPQED